MSNPVLPEQARAELVRQLGAAAKRYEVAKTIQTSSLKRAIALMKSSAHSAKRGEVWWDDGTPDYNRRMVPEFTVRRLVPEYPGRSLLA